MSESKKRKNANDEKRHTNLSCLHGLMGSIHFVSGDDIEPHADPELTESFIHSMSR